MKSALFMATGSAVLFFAATAAAERPFTEEKVSLSGHLGYGAYLDDNVLDLNPYSFGLGVRGGYTLDPNIYIGGLFDFFFGESDDVGALGATAETSANSWLFQVEGGYDFGVSRNVVIRPKMGLGVTTVSVDGCAGGFGIGGCVDDSDSEFSFGLGGEVLIDLDPVFIAPELRFNLGDDISALIIMVGVGGTI